MNIQKLHLKLNKLESQKLSIENEIIQIKKQINKSSSFSKQDKVKLFKSLFIGRDDVYRTFPPKNPHLNPYQREIPTLTTKNVPRRYLTYNLLFAIIQLPYT